MNESKINKLVGCAILLGFILLVCYINKSDEPKPSKLEMYHGQMEDAQNLKRAQDSCFGIAEKLYNACVETELEKESK